MNIRSEDHAKSQGPVCYGEPVLATVMFADICGFSSLTVALGHQRTLNLLNEYFGLTIKCVEEEHGYVDKLIGDGLMAVFGVPVPTAADEDHAVRAAVAILRELGSWNRRRIADGEPPIDMRIGIHTEIAIYGRIGAHSRTDETVIGHGVNLAARLERACKHYGVPLLISEFTRRGLRGSFQVRLADVIDAPGVRGPLPIYDVLDHYDALSRPGLDALLAHYNRGLSLYRQRRFSEAALAFEAALALDPDDQLSRLFVTRTRRRGPLPQTALERGTTLLRNSRDLHSVSVYDAEVGSAGQD